MEKAPQAALQCPRCEAANLPDRKFCSKCGTPLWEACFQCGEISAVGENFCGACGANLGDAVAEQLERVQDAFRAVTELREACRFNEAIALLTPVTKNTHPRLLVYASRASNLVGQLTSERERRRVASEETLQSARQCCAQSQYDEAARLLETVPEAYRTGSVRELIDELSARQQEIRTLRQSLGEGIRAKRVLEILPTVERLLVLQPGDAEAATLADRIRKHLFAAAEKALAEYRYDDALAMLEQLGGQIGGPRAKELFQNAAELAWLRGDLQQSPIIDPTLLAVAERLRRLTPADAPTAKLIQQLRAQAAKSQGQRGPILWAKPPQETPLGVPVDWFNDLPRFQRAATFDAIDYDKSSGRFIVACGLALAGLRRAALNVNLLKSSQLGTLQRFKNLLRGAGKVAWGLDLSTSGLKAVKLSWDSAKQQAVLEAGVLIEHAKSLNNAANEAESLGLVGDTLKAFVERCQPGGESLCVGLPGRLALSRQVEMPPADRAKLPKMIEFEAQQQFPFPLEQLSWDHEVLRDADPSQARGQWRSALLIAAQNAIVHRFLEPFRRLKLHVDTLQTDFVALHNAVAHQFLPGPTDVVSPLANGAVAAVDIGCDVTNIVISGRQTLWFHSCGIAGFSWSRSLVKEFNLSLAQAEQLKRAPELAKSLSEMYMALAPQFEELSREVQQSLAAYARTSPDCPVQRVVGLGGGFLLHGLFRYFRTGR